MDAKWWELHHVEVERVFKGKRYTVSPVPHAQRVVLYHGGNSGAGALSLAARFGAERIIMLGYDCKHGQDGKRHWHGDHPKGSVGNAGSVGKWPAQFKELAQVLKGVEIVNATRDTALTVWPRVSLEDALA